MTEKQIRIYFIITVLIGISVALFLGGSHATINPAPGKLFSSQDFINMTDSVFFKIKEQEIMNMIKDSAKAHELRPIVLCGLSWHESDRFKYAHRKIKDSNGRWSYGLFMILMETALSIYKKVTEEK